MSMRKAPGLRLQTSIVQDNVPVEIAPGLFVGSIHAAFNVDMLKSNKISHVLNLAGSYATFPEDFTYLSISIRDKDYANLLSCLPIAAVFIDAGLKDGGVLIHCTGGRSRSPAVAMAFLMMKQQIPYLAVSAHVKALRPVVNLNAGFDAQLKLLDTACGDVFIANQQLLKSRVARLAQQHKDGELVHEIAQKRRPWAQVSSQPPPSPMLKKHSSIEMLASGCDDRGMLGERVSSGFCLSLPPGEYSMATADKLPLSSFIPTLRSMGTMFGCQCCGESLFCAGAIIHHNDAATLTCKGDEFPMNGQHARFLGALRGSTTSNFTPSDVTVGKEQVVVTNMSKKLMLAKLRLRPYSPSVTMRNGSRPVSSTEILTTRQTNASSVVFTKPKFEILQRAGEDANTCLPQPLRPAQEESKRLGSTASLSGNRESKTSGSGLWRSLISFNHSKRTAKTVADKKRIHGQHRVGDTPEQSKSAILSSVHIEDASGVGLISTHLIFLKKNIVEWHQSFRQLLSISKNSSLASRESTIEQVTALLDEDAIVLAGLNSCKQWLIDPQSWTIAQASARPEGDIRCPRETCRAVVGEWRWEGLRNSCGDSIAPAFVMKRDAVCVLGNMTAQSIELMDIVDREAHPEE